MESQSEAKSHAGWMTLEEAARYTSLGRSTLYAALNSGQLGYAKVGRCRRVSKVELDRFMAAASVPARAAD